MSGNGASVLDASRLAHTPIAENRMASADSDSPPVSPPTEIPPALTPEEWAEKMLNRREYRYGFQSYLTDDNGDELIVNGEWTNDGERHALAALCLYQQPFGFTQEDVTLLRDEAEDEWNGAEMEPGRRLLGLAARIAALLPPSPDPSR